MHALKVFCNGHPGELQYPEAPAGLVIFCHGTGSSQNSPRNRWIADALFSKQYASLRVNFEADEPHLLAHRILEVILWTRTQPFLVRLPLVLLGSSTGAAGAFLAAAQWPHRFKAVISRGGRPDLVKEILNKVRAPTLFIVGQRDEFVLRLNRDAFDRLGCKKKLEIVPGASHLFEEPGMLEQVVEALVQWLDGNVKSALVPFPNRELGGVQLGKRIRGKKLQDPIVLAVPRGGVVTGVALAQAIEADLEVIIARKLRHPDTPELALGALCEGNIQVLTELGKKFQEAHPKVFKEEVRKQSYEIEKRISLFRKSTKFPKVKGRSVFVVDDGLATGSTMLAVLQALRKQNPFEIILAVPVAPQETLREMEPWCDEIVCLATPEPFYAVGEFYNDFRQVEDDQVVEKLKSFLQTKTRTRRPNLPLEAS